MKKYNYSGIDLQGARVSGELNAMNTLDAERQLTQMGIELLTMREKKAYISFFKRNKVANQDVITMTFQLEQLLRAGVPLLDVLDDLRNAFDSGYFKNVLSGVYDTMLNGATFAEALAKYPDVFNEVYVSLVGVGEKTGKLEVILHDLGVNLRWQDELEAKAKKIFIYPAIVFSVVITVITFLMIFLVPQLVSFIQSMGQELGILTSSLIVVSNFFVNYWLVILITLLGAVVAFKYLMYQFPKFKLLVHKHILSIKLIGPIIFKLKIARMTNTMAIMYAAGVSMQEIIDMAAKVVGNSYLYSKLKDVELSVLDGHSIASSFAATGIFPPLIVKLIKVGEMTGKMDEALRNISYFYDREAKELIEKIEPAIEPIITLFLAVLVGWVMMATLGPVYDIIGKLK
jgi:type IV pilus assembly protein PilC